MTKGETSGDLKANTPIPEEFVYEAAKHLAERGEPLLRPPLPADERVLLAWASGDEYQLSDAGWRPPTWRQYAARAGEDLLGVLEQYAGPDAEPDERMPKDLADQLIDDGDNELAAAVSLLEPLLIRRFVCLTSPRLEELGVELGELEWWDGRFPGDNFTAVYASTPLALSCLQFVLDERRTGIRLQLADTENVE